MTLGEIRMALGGGTRAVLVSCNRRAAGTLCWNQGPLGVPGRGSSGINDISDTNGINAKSNAFLHPKNMLTTIELLCLIFISSTTLASASYPACQRCYALPTVRQAEMSNVPDTRLQRCYASPYGQESRNEASPLRVRRYEW